MIAPTVAFIGARGGVNAHATDAGWGTALFVLLLVAAVFGGLFWFFWRVSK